MAVVERSQYSEAAVLVRCPRCLGLREVSAREMRRKKSATSTATSQLFARSVCQACSRVHVVPVSAFFAFWTERFTPEEIREMAKAIWG